MRTRARLTWCALGLLLCAAPARGELGTIDTVPAATLLLPYFEVDLADANGITTVFSLVNSGHHGTPPDMFGNAASAALAHVTLWTDLGIPTVAFDVYLTGYDLQSINLREVFAGILPTTASDGQDPTDTSNPNDGISNQGLISQDINFASCTGNLPYPSPALTAQQIADLRNAHTGQASGLLGGNCGARNLGDSIARGFVTIDAVTQCSPLFPPVSPASPGYFSGIAEARNLFGGDFLYADLANNFGQADALVPIQAAPDPSFVPGDYTFYGRFVSGIGSDRREPLATRWAVPYQDKPAHNLTTELIVWRDPIDNPAPFPCGGALPAPFPLAQKEVVAFDMAENPEVPAPAEPPFPVVAMRTRLNGAPPSLPVTPRAGWVMLDLNSPADVASSPFANKAARQSWVMVLRSGEGRYSHAHAAIQLDNALDAPPTPPPSPPSEEPTPGDGVATPQDTPPDTPLSPDASPMGGTLTATMPPPQVTPDRPDGGGRPGREQPPEDDTPGVPI